MIDACPEKMGGAVIEPLKATGDRVREYRG